MAVIFNSKSLCGDLIKELQARNACKEATDWILSKAKVEETIGELFNTHIYTKDCAEVWAVWMLQNLYPLLAQDLRLKLIKKITNEMTAFSLFLDCKDLNVQEEKLLSLVFKGKLPKAEKELAMGIVTRAKLCQ